MPEPPINDGPNQAVEDQLLNQGTSAEPASVWSCVVPDTQDELAVGIYGQSDGLVGVLSPDGVLDFLSSSYTISAAGTVTFVSEPDLVILQTPDFTSGTTFTTNISLDIDGTPGIDGSFDTNCQLVSFSANVPIPTPDINTDPQPTPPGNLEARLLNRGTQASPQEGWDCEGTLLGFYGSGQGRIGLSPSFNVMEYAVNGDVVQIRANGSVGELSNILFSGPDNFSTLLFDGSNSLGIDCSRFALSLSSSSRSAFPGEIFSSQWKSMVSNKQLQISNMPKRH